MEGARLGRVGHVIVRDQFGCISELCGKDPGGLLVGTSIPNPADEIQQLAVTAVLIDLRVEDLGDLKLWLTIYEDGRGWWLYLVRDRVWGCGSSFKMWNTGWMAWRLSGSRSMTKWVPGCAITS